MNFSLRSIETVNYLNVFLMLFSLVLAYFYPFELFLFSFIFMGPLHYLTEISWLEKKNFYLPQRITVLMLLLVFLSFSVLYFYPIPSINPFINSLLFCTVVLCATLVFNANSWVSILCFVGAFVFILLSHWYEQDWFLIVFTIFLPTIIHISIFTGLFILSGIVKSKKEISGWISLLCFVFCTAFFFIIPFHNQSYIASSAVQSLYFDFIVLNKKFADFFHFGQINQLEDIFTSKEGIIIMQFIAFSYTYHYLNWFTKTSVIKWHEVSRMRMAGILVTYVAILGLFFFDKTWGISLLTLLSLAHLILEFPLNWVSIKAVFSLKSA